MEIKKDLKNVLFTFGIVALTVYAGSDIYVRQELDALEQSIESEEAAQALRERVRVDTKDVIDTYTETLDTIPQEDGPDAVVLVPETVPDTIATPTVSLPAKAPVVPKAAPVVPQATQPQQLLTEAEIARIQAQITAAQKATDALIAPKPVTVSTVTPSVPTETVTVKKSRRSRAS
jgi:hypothetical protein